MATSAPASGRGVEVKQVIISPASSNPKLEFTGNFKQAFKPSSSLRGAFEHHAAYKATFRTEEDGTQFSSRGPDMTLMGTVEDWKLLREKIERVLEFEVQDNPEGKVLEVWVGYLRKVCDGFVESAEHPDSAATVDFWDKVFSDRYFGSGVTFTTGWVSTFSCFDKDGNFIGNTREGGEFPLVTSLCHNVVSCPVAIDDNGYEYDATLFTGQVAYRAKRGIKGIYPTIRPRSDWCLAVAVK